MAVLRGRIARVSRRGAGQRGERAASGVVAMRAAAGMPRRERDGRTSASGRALYYTTQSNVGRDKVHSFFAIRHDFLLLFTGRFEI